MEKTYLPKKQTHGKDIYTKKTYTQKRHGGDIHIEKRVYGRNINTKVVRKEHKYGKDTKWTYIWRRLIDRGDIYMEKTDIKR